MVIEIKVPMLPESVADATVAVWHKKEGDFVKEGDNLLDLETDKVTLEVPSPTDGLLEKIFFPKGAIVKTSEILGTLKKETQNKKEEAFEKNNQKDSQEISLKNSHKDTQEKLVLAQKNPRDSIFLKDLSPSARRLAHDLDLRGAPLNSRLRKEDILSQVETSSKIEERVPMSRLRQQIAKRLVEAQKTAALLTTFNEVNMKPVMDLRAKYKDSFEKRHGVKLGFMPFFIKAAVEALKRFPNVNAFIDGTDVIYHAYQDISIAVSTEKGLVVPVLRNVDSMAFADIEKSINDFSIKAREGKLSLEEMTGGTFTITNGGVFGSLMSTPIINPPQSAILGMHAIKERAIVEKGEIVARPMMYLALSYDHRIIDGKDSVQFLSTIKDLIEDPSRLILDI